MITQHPMHEFDEYFSHDSTKAIVSVQIDEDGTYESSRDVMSSKTDFEDEPLPENAAWSIRSCILTTLGPTLLQARSAKFLWLVIAVIWSVEV